MPTNPYLPIIDTVVARLLEGDPVRLVRESQRDDFVHFDADNEWIYPSLAACLKGIAFAHAHHESRHHGSARTRECATRLFEFLTEAAVDNRWYHRAPRKGDPNIDRFTLLPFMDAYARLDKELPAALAERALQVIRGVLKVQRREYGQDRIGFPRGLYPNMDAYYCVIMLVGHQLTGCTKCQAEYRRFLSLMEQAQFAGGAWTYINGTNECPVYHGLNTVLMARVWAASGEERARRMLERSIPYYPRIVSPQGIPEYHTDPWWKHTWEDLQEPYGPDTVASVTGDGTNRWIADRLRGSYADKLAAFDLQAHAAVNFCVDAAALWREVTPVPPNVGGIRYDANIEGPRGIFPDWSWAATARHGSDTLVGARLHAADGSVVALMGVTPEIAHRLDDQPDDGLTRLALGMTPPDTKGQTSIEGGSARFEARYPMAGFRSVWEQAPYPSAWECQQEWHLDARSIRGRITVISSKDQFAPPALVRVRFGKNLKMENPDDRRFQYGPFTLEIGHNDFPKRSVQLARTCPYLKALDATEIVFSQPDARQYRPGECWLLELGLTITS